MSSEERRGIVTVAENRSPSLRDLISQLHALCDASDEIYDKMSAMDHFLTILQISLEEGLPKRNLVKQPSFDHGGMIYFDDKTFALLILAILVGAPLILPQHIYWRELCQAIDRNTAELPGLYFRGLKELARLGEGWRSVNTIRSTMDGHKPRIVTRIASVKSLTF